MNFFKKIFDHEYKELEKFKVLANEVMALEDDMSKLKDKDFKARTEEFIKRTDTYNMTIGGGMPPKFNKIIYE